MPSCHYERIPLSDDHPSPQNSTSPPSAPPSFHTLDLHPSLPHLNDETATTFMPPNQRPPPAPQTLLSDSTSEAWPEPEESLLLARAREIEAMDEDREALRRLCEQVRLIEERIGINESPPSIKDEIGRFGGKLQMGARSYWRTELKVGAFLVEYLLSNAGVIVEPSVP